MYYSDFVIPGSYLAHHGVKGQKWGIRRYQNYDGSLKPRGEKRLKRDIKDIKYLRDRVGLVKGSERAHNSMTNQINNAIFNSEILYSIIKKTKSENSKLFEETMQKKDAVQKILQDSVNKGFDSFMSVDKTPEYKKAMNDYVQSITEYNKAYGKTITSMLGNMGNEKVPGTNISYNDYVTDVLAWRPNITVGK